MSSNSEKENLTGRVISCLALCSKHRDVLKCIKGTYNKINGVFEHL
jgi:hypothetical protein